MTGKLVYTATAGLVLTSVLALTGCNMTLGPRLGIFAYPIPLSPYFQHKQEENFWVKERYGRVPILQPIVPGAPCLALDTPSDDEVMRALEKARPVEGGIPLGHEIQRNNVRIVKEQICDTIDPPRVLPLVGPTQLHHARWKCTVYFQEVTRVGWPVPYTTKNEDTREVIYIDHDHLHMVGNVDTGTGPAP